MIPLILLAVACLTVPPPPATRIFPPPSGGTIHSTPRIVPLSS